MTVALNAVTVTLSVNPWPLPVVVVGTFVKEPTCLPTPPSLIVNEPLTCSCWDLTSLNTLSCWGVVWITELPSATKLISPEPDLWSPVFSSLIKDNPGNGKVPSVTLNWLLTSTLFPPGAFNSRSPERDSKVFPENFKLPREILVGKIVVVSPVPVTTNWSKVVPPASPPPTKDTVPFSWSTKNALPTRKSPFWSILVKSTLPPVDSIISFAWFTLLISFEISKPVPT